MCRNRKNRRDFLKEGALLGSGASILLNAPLASSAEGPETPELKGRKPFVLYLHFGSMCGVSAGLAQPIVPGQWKPGLFARGANTGSVNPLINQHTKHGSLVFHEYNKMLGEIAGDMCLMNGTPESLDHFVARLMQSRGNGIPNTTPEWPMAVSQFSKTPSNPNPMLISAGSKSLSVPDVSLVQSNSINNFKVITTDYGLVPKNNVDPIWQVLQDRFKIDQIGSTKVESSVQQTIKTQLSTLTNGLPALNEAQADIDSITAALSATSFNSLMSYHSDKADIRFNRSLSDQLALAGILAKTGLASGMTIEDGSNDLHFGGADVVTARDASARWALITLFWKWCQANGLDNDVMVVVSHDFGRGPYNASFLDYQVKTGNATTTISSPGRDHGLYFGMMVINKNVPSMGRIGNVIDNLTPVPSTNSTGGFDASKNAHLASDLMGTMLMRVYPDLFKTERMIRKHWPNFKEVAAILNA